MNFEKKISNIGTENFIGDMFVPFLSHLIWSVQKWRKKNIKKNTQKKHKKCHQPLWLNVLKFCCFFISSICFHFDPVQCKLLPFKSKIILCCTSYVLLFCRFIDHFHIQTDTSNTFDIQKTIVHTTTFSVSWSPV